jgi:hypothetical protein
MKNISRRFHRVTRSSSFKIPQREEKNEFKSHIELKLSKSSPSESSIKLISQKKVEFKVIVSKKRKIS